MLLFIHCTIDLNNDFVHNTLIHIGYLYLQVNGIVLLCSCFTGKIYSHDHILTYGLYTGRAKTYEKEIKNGRKTRQEKKERQTNRKKEINKAKSEWKNGDRQTGRREYRKKDRRDSRKKKKE